MKNQSLVMSLALIIALTGCEAQTTSPLNGPEGLAHLGDQMRAKGDDGAAAEFYQRALLRNSQDEEARQGLAEILEAHGDNNAAAQQYAELVKNDPDNAGAHHELGRVLLKMGRAEEAKEQYNEALRLEPDDIKSLNGLGVALDFLGNHVAAQSAYKEALEQKPDDLPTLNNLAHSYVLVGAYDEAIKLLEPHIKDQGATPAMRQNLAEAYGMAGMKVDAERVAEMDLNNTDVKHNLAYYNTRRTQLSLIPKLYADLGSYPTQDMADAHVDEIKSKFDKESAGLIIKAESSVDTIGGTPSFSVRATGFARADKVRTFCDRLKKEHLACKAHF